MIRVKTIRAEFEAARSSGYVYGQIVRQTVFPVYIELGKEREYTASPNDNPNTEYRFFAKCSVYVAETEDQLDRENYLATSLGVDVVIYC
jgi:hypothetical protein